MINLFRSNIIDSKKAGGWGGGGGGNNVVFLKMYVLRREGNPAFS